MGNASEYLITRPQRTQHCVVANLTRTGRADVEDYRRIGILRLSELFTFRVLMRNYFNASYRREKNREYDVRHERRFLVNRCFNKYGDRTRENLIPRLLNDLPVELRNLERYSMLKDKLRQWVMDSRS